MLRNGSWSCSVACNRELKGCTKESIFNVLIVFNFALHGARKTNDVHTHKQKNLIRGIKMIVIQSSKHGARGEDDTQRVDSSRNAVRISLEVRRNYL